MASRLFQYLVAQNNYARTQWPCFEQLQIYRLFEERYTAAQGHRMELDQKFINQAQAGKGMDQGRAAIMTIFFPSCCFNLFTSSTILSLTTFELFHFSSSGFKETIVANTKSNVGVCTPHCSLCLPFIASLALRFGWLAFFAKSYLQEVNNQD